MTKENMAMKAKFNKRRPVVKITGKLFVAAYDERTDRNIMIPVELVKQLIGTVSIPLVDSDASQKEEDDA